ncbi:hypothetical protein [Haliscomenobacter sp.]|uniref:hypothetical protein n=1 Tax=Haliscomenobacter sp. TaxID=2717303 RepID=UPI0033652D6F
MKWLKSIVVKWVREDWEETGNATNEVLSMTKPSRLVAREHDWHENLSLSITTANGGKIVSFRRYDHKTDRHDNKIYVVPDDHDFNAELGKLITLESMR